MRTASKPSNGRCSVSMSIAAFSVIAMMIYFLQLEDSSRHSESHKLVHPAHRTVPERTLQEGALRKIDPLSELMRGNRQQKSKFAYVTLLSGIDSSYKYRGFLYNVLIMKRALQKSGSVADFIALIGLSEKDMTPFQADFKLLQDAGVIIHILPRFVDEQHSMGFAEMALLKITPWSFTQYKRMQFLDGDVMPLQNMDCFFRLDSNSFTVGAVSPLNSGWYLAIPDKVAYEYMKEKSIWRLERDWNKVTGWKEVMPRGLMYRGGTKQTERWEFNGADMDQGLLLHYFVINNGNALLIDTDTRTSRFFEKGLLRGSDVKGKAEESLTCCMGVLPTHAFAHFTGRSKPWMLKQDDFDNARKGGSLSIWKAHLDSLNLPVNSSNILGLGLGSPLGFWNAGFPKGGFTKGAVKGEGKGRKLRI